MDGRGLEVKTVSKLLMEILGRWKRIQNALFIELHLAYDLEKTLF